MRVRRRVYRQPTLTARQEKLQAARDIYEMRARVLCTGAAFVFSQSFDNLTAFDNLRDFINTDIAEAVDNASRAKKRYEDSFPLSPRRIPTEPSPRSRKSKPSTTGPAKQKTRKKDS